MTDPPQEPRRRPRPYPPGGGPPVDDDPAAGQAADVPAAPSAEPGSGRRTALLAAAAVLVVATVVIAVVFLVLNGNRSDDQARSGSSPSAVLSQTPQATYSSATERLSGVASQSGSATPTGTSSVAQVAARDLVLAYLDDVNARDGAAAGKLICPEKYATWKKNAESANGDLAYTVVKSTFQESHVAPGGGLVVTYALEFDDGTANRVAFTVVKQTSLKICGIA